MSESEQAEGGFMSPLEGISTAKEVGDLFHVPGAQLLSPFGLVNGAHKMLHGDNVVEQVEGGLETFAEGTQTAELLGEGASLLSGAMGEGTAASVVGGVGETLTAGAEMLAPVAELAGPAALALGGGYALGTGIDWLAGKVFGKKPSDALADWMGERQDRATEKRLGIHMFTDPAKRGTQHIQEMPKTWDEVLHNEMYKQRITLRGKTQAEPFQHFAN